MGSVLVHLKAQRSRAEALCRGLGLDYNTAASAAGLSASDFDCVLLAGIFDQEFYRAAYPDIVQAELNPLLHYLKNGRFEKRKPCETFDPVAYLEINPQAADSQLEPFLHYVLIGQAVQTPRSRADMLCRAVGLNCDAAASVIGLSQREFDAIVVAFDSAAYLDANPEVGRLGVAPLVHYVLAGRAAHAPRSRAEALCRELGLDYETAASAAGLSAGDFDCVLLAGVFDQVFYRATYPDIVQAELNPLLHYLKNGRFEKRKPAEIFDPVAYLDVNPQVADSQIEPFLHYVLVGRAAKAPISRADMLCREIGFDLKHLRESPPDLPQLLSTLQTSPEYTAVLEPVIAEIGSIFASSIMRTPEPIEVINAIAMFYDFHGTLVSRMMAVKEGAIRPHLGIRPLKLEMDIVNQCNLRCVMCHFSSPENFTKRKKEITLVDFSRVADEIFSLCFHVSLSVSTEPFLHQNLSELLRITRKHHVPFVHMYTNGILLRQSTMTALIQHHVHQISVSIDGATKKTYEQIRVGGKLERLIENIKAINKLKQDLQSEIPHIGFNVVLMRSNIKELPSLVLLAQSLNVKTIYACHMVPLKSAMVSPTESLQFDKDLCNQMLDEARRVAKIHQIHVAFPANFATEIAAPSPDPVETTPIEFEVSAPNPLAAVEPSCRFPWYFVGLEPGGNIIPCGWWYSELPMGNIFTESFAAIWNNDRYRKLRSEHQRLSGLRHICQACPVSGMGNVDNANSFTTR